MIVTIAQYLEAMTNNDGRFRTLERVRTMRDEAGEPLFTMPGHGLVDFEVVTRGERYVLRCPLRYDASAASRLRALSEKDRGSGSKFFTEWQLLAGEIVLFDESGAAFEVDILARPTPAGERFTDFLESAVARADRAAVVAVSRSFAELVEWVHGMGRDGICARRLLVAPDGSVSLPAFSANDETERIFEMLRKAESDCLTAGTSRKQSIVSGYDLSDDDNVRVVRDGGGWMYIDRRGRTAIDTVWLSASPFRGGRAEVETHSGKGLIDRTGKEVVSSVYEELVWDDSWEVAAVQTEGRWSLVDRNGRVLTEEFYDWIGECSEGLILVQRDGRCGFLDTEGRPVIPCIYDDASSFAEGYALVTSEGESFFIDARGRKI